MGNTKSSVEITTSKRNSSISRSGIPDDRKLNVPNKKNSKRPSTSSQGSASARSVKPVLPLAQRQIVKGCMDNAKDDIAERIYRRVLEKRDDFRAFVELLSNEQRNELADNLRDFLKGVVERLMDPDEVQRISEEFGEKHVQFRSAGFRPDFFVATADAVTTECVFLDAALHQASDTLAAWSTLTSITFSSVRDGYYNELRRQRRASNCTVKSKIAQEIAAIAEDNSQKENSATPRQGSRSLSPAVILDGTESATTDETSGRSMEEETTEDIETTESSEAPIEEDEQVEDEENEETEAHNSSEEDEQSNNSQCVLPPKEVDESQ